MKSPAFPALMAIATNIIIPSSAHAAGAPPATVIDFPIRVAVIRGAAEINISVRGRYEMLALPRLEPLKEGRGLRKARVLPAESGLIIGGKPMMIYGIRIRPETKSAITINRRRFRGDIDIIRTEKKRLLVINRVNLEEYLYGVLYNEVSHRWPMDALMAQAIVSRTFAVYQAVANQHGDYDLTNDAYSQVYGGRSSEQWRTTRAVNRTAGLVLAYNGAIFPAYFHATCGGRTEDASELWDIDIPPLRGRRCAYCRISPHYRWNASMTLSDIENKLISEGYEAAGLKSISVRSRNRSGRVKEMEIGHAGGTEMISANSFRLAVGPGRIRSANFTVRVRVGEAIFEGKGWGHGVGMCQWGAYAMSRDGVSHDKILKFYYPHSEIVPLEKVVILE